MESVEVNERGQIKISREAMEKLGIQSGMKFDIIKNEVGYYYLLPATKDPLKELQRLLSGEAERLGLKTDDDVVKFSKNIAKKELKKMQIMVDANAIKS